MHRLTSPGRSSALSLDDRIAHLERELARLRQLRRDRDDERLLYGLRRSLGGAVFTCRDVIAHAEIDPDLRRLLRGITPRKLGVRLARLVDRDVRGFRVSRVIENESGWMWVLHFHPHTSVDDDADR